MAKPSKYTQRLQSRPAIMGVFLCPVHGDLGEAGVMHLLMATSCLKCGREVTQIGQIRIPIAAPIKPPPKEPVESHKPRVPIDVKLRPIFGVTSPSKLDIPRRGTLVPS